MTGLGWTQDYKRVECPKCKKVQTQRWDNLFESGGKARCINCNEILTTENIKKNKIKPKSKEQLEKNKMKLKIWKEIYLKKSEVTK